MDDTVLNSRTGGLTVAFDGNQFLKLHTMEVIINGIKIDVRSSESLYVTIGDWVVYLDNSTGEKIISSREN